MESTRSFDPPGGATDGAYLDTIALLQEEIARLESELLMRDDEPYDSAPEPPNLLAGSAAEDRVEELAALLDERDETITLLWAQVAALEETQAARAAEWDQLHRWVEELEARFGDEGRSEIEHGEARREAEALRDQLESQRRAWEGQRRLLEGEVAALRGRLEGAAGSGGDPAIASLEDENRRLRDECRRLSGIEAEGADREALAQTLRIELDRAEARILAAESDLQRERLRHEAELAELRARQAANPLASGELSPNERVRALRDHLRELHAQEQEERRDRQLSARISRLLGRSGTRR